MRRAQKQQKRWGAVTVEAAIALPLAFAFMFAIFDVGRAIATKQLQNNVVNCMGNLALQGMSVQVYQADPITGANIGPWTSAANGHCIAVQVTGNFVPIIPTFSLLHTPVPMSSTALVGCEAN